MTEARPQEDFRADPLQPLIYVSVPLAALHATDDGQETGWVSEVKALLDAAKIANWEPQVYSGLEFFRDWSGDPECDDAADRVFRLNSNAAWSYADALIIFRVDGGSTGVGVELGWACTLGIPILYLHPADERISRLVRGLRTEADLVVTQINTPAEAMASVREFLLARKSLIEDLARRRASWHERLEPLRATLAAAWSERTTLQRPEVCGVARLTERRVDRLVSDVSALGAAGLREVSALAGALGVDYGSGPDLHPHQIKALSTASERQGWSGVDTIQLYEIGRLEVRQPTQNKWGFGDPSDWEELYDEYLAGRTAQGA